MKPVWFFLLITLSAASCGCGTIAYSAKALQGITYYCPGAGNTDFGDAGLRSGLESAGYKGEVAAYVWTISFNVAIDQTLRFNAKLKGQGLARLIEGYMDKYPGAPVNVVGLSAGTGVAVWALEDLKDGYNVDNVVLLGSSLWHRYDVGKAARHVKGKIYVYYSSNDAILAGPMKLIGSIDGVFGEDGAGSVGLHTKGGADRVMNISWKPEYQSLGYFGGHTDSTASGFVRAVLSKHLLSGASGAPASPGTAPPKPQATAPPAVVSR